MSEDKTESLICFPTLAVKNKKGEILFALKRKEEGDRLYYLFELHLDKETDPEKREQLKEVWEKSKAIARILDIPLYNVEEITNEVFEVMKRQKKQDLEELPLIVLDHATGERDILIINARVRDIKGLNKFPEKDYNTKPQYLV